MSKLKNKVAVVTGASKGIGASVAKHFAEAGAKVVINYQSSKVGADSVVKAITDLGGSAIALQGDVSNEADVTRLFDETQKALGALDILVNNAVFQGYAPLDQISAQTFHQSFNTNVLGRFTVLNIVVRVVLISFWHNEIRMIQ